MNLREYWVSGPVGDIQITAKSPEEAIEVYIESAQQLETPVVVTPDQVTAEEMDW